MVDLIRMTYGSTGGANSNALGMRPLQARVYEARAA
ncbi:hypothetical protein SAMN04489759_103381 [Sulfitobacter delicatus]|uniref:Uncharacterized protein n=1 Tax=Sulfitobacter delicatus TaxID=218672 RepID=A0A1G7PLL7_9RHOB|nr:hypothetical protein SAMN04489759_103381 [Sulfitobacter delicatus]